MAKNINFLILIIACFSTSVQFCYAQTVIETKEEEKAYVDFIINHRFGEIPDQTLYSIINRIKSIYSPVMREEWGKSFDIYVLKTFKSLANANTDEDLWWSVNLGLEFLKQPYMTEDSIVALICHEIGHFLGGPPKYVTNNVWASIQGPADYFAASQCLRRYFEGQDNQSIVSKMPVPRYVTVKCQDNFSHPEDTAVCQRGAMASFLLIVALAIERETVSAVQSVSFQTPDTSSFIEIPTTQPSSQCRLDTYFQGVLCNRPRDDETCLGPDGQRPRCWFNF